MTSILSGMEKKKTYTITLFIVYEYFIYEKMTRYQAVTASIYRVQVYCCDPKLLFNDLFFRMIKKNDEVYEPTIHHWRQMLSGALHHRLQSESKTDQHYVNSTFALKSKERHDKQR